MYSHIYIYIYMNSTNTIFTPTQLRITSKTESRRLGHGSAELLRL